MVARKRRIWVVFDTNVFIRSFKSLNKASANKQVIRLWIAERALQLILSAELIDEYLSIFETVVGMTRIQLARWRRYFEDDSRSTVIRPVHRYKVCRDADDNRWLDLAAAGQADYLITNDKDLLVLADRPANPFPFSIVSPGEFLQATAAGS